MHDVHKACCYYSSRSCRVNPYRLTGPLSDIPTETKILFLPTKWKKSQLGMGIWHVVASFIHKMSPPTILRRFLFILSFECCFIQLALPQWRAQQRLCRSTFHSLLSVRSVCLMHRWCQSAPALTLAASSQATLSASQVLDQSLEFNWDEWLVREPGLWFELPWSRDVQESSLLPEGIITQSNFLLDSTGFS